MEYHFNFFLSNDRTQGEPSLGAGLDVAQEQEEGGERTDWQVKDKICIELIKNTRTVRDSHQLQKSGFIQFLGGFHR